MALATLTAVVVAAAAIEGSTVAGFALERGESITDLATDRDALLVGVAYRTPHGDVRPGGDEQEYSSVRVLAAGGVTATARRRGVLRKIVPVTGGFALLRVITTYDARDTVTELTVVEAGGAERVVFSGRQDLTGFFVGGHGEWVLFGGPRVLVAAGAAGEPWTPLELAGLEPGEWITGMASLDAEEYVAVTQRRVLRYATSGALLSSRVVGRYPYPIRLIAERRLWVVREEQDLQELSLVENDGSLRRLKEFAPEHVRWVSSIGDGALVLLTGGARAVHARRWVRVTWRGDARGRGAWAWWSDVFRRRRSDEVATLPDDAMRSTPWKDGLAVATPTQLYSFRGVGAR
jgi:hypothetical protein